MLSKEELLAKDVPELEDIARSIGASFNKDDDKDTLVYAILDKGAEDEGKAHPLGAKRHRTRISRPETDHVYSVNGKEVKTWTLRRLKSLRQRAPSSLRTCRSLLRLIQRTKTTIKK